MNGGRGKDIFFNIPCGTQIFELPELSKLAEQSLSPKIGGR